MFHKYFIFKMFKFGLIIITISLLASINSADIKNRSRQGKIFSFIADNEDVEVGLDFSIPFIKIPVTKTLNAVAEFGIPGISLPKININPTALILGGFLIAFTSVIGPFMNKKFDWHHIERSSRISDNDDFNSSQTLHLTELLLANSRACPQRVACWTGKRNKNTEVMQTWKHIISNKLLSTMVNTTALKEATLRGLKGENCESYTPCPIEEKALPMIIENFGIITNLK